MNTYVVQKTARTWDSYKNPLLTVLHVLNPKSVLEYGPGESTKVFHAHNSISLIDSIEHSPAWGEKIDQNSLFKIKLYLEIKHYKYPYVKTRLNSYDLIFVDGIERPSCISVSRFRLNSNGIVVVHDAERLEYKQAYELWDFKFFVDGGHTVLLTNDIETANIIEKVI